MKNVNHETYPQWWNSSDVMNLEIWRCQAMAGFIQTFWNKVIVLSRVTATHLNGWIWLGVSKNKGTPKWMVYNGKPYQNGWFGDTIIFGNLQRSDRSCFTDTPKRPEYPRAPATYFRGPLVRSYVLFNVWVDMSFCFFQ